MSTYIIQTLPEGDTYPLSYNGEVDGDLQERMRNDGFTLSSNDAVDLRLATSREMGYASGADNMERSIRDRLIAYYRDEVSDIDALNELLSYLDMEAYESKWLVRVLCEGEMVLEVVVEADSEEDAIDMLSGNIDQCDDEVEVEFYYSGSGETVDGSAYAYNFGSLFDFLHFDYEAEPYDG